MAKTQAPGPRKTSLSTYIIYGAIIVFILLACCVIGAALDLSVQPDGNINFELIDKSIGQAVSQPTTLIKLVVNADSYANKMLFMGAFATGIYLLYKYAGGKKRLHRQGVEHGSAKWGDDKEKKSLADPAKPHLEPIRDDNGKKIFDDKGEFESVTIDNNLILSEDVKLSLNARQHLLNLNVLIIGGSGSGKTRFYAKPNTMQLNTSYVITDPKGEILQSTGKMLLQAGYKLKVFNTINMKNSNNYDPFEYVYDYDGNLSEDNVIKMVDVLFKNTKGDGEKEDFWSQKGKSLLQAIVFLLFEESEYNAKLDENRNVIPETRDKTILNFFSVTEKMRKLIYPPKSSQIPDGFFLERDPNESEDEYRARQASCFLCPLDKDFIELEKRKPDSIAIRLYKEVRNAPEETGQSFLSSANVKTFMFNVGNLKHITCCDNIHLETIGDEKTALFIIISATDSTYYWLASMMYTQMFDVLSNRANFKYGGVLPVHVRCIMDEFANISQIPDFDKVIAFVRSMGISLNVIIQNMAQLKARYEKTWEIITGNCDSTIFLGGKEESTLKSISEQLGKETIDIVGKNRTKGGKSSSTSENNSIIGRELMLPNELQVMPISDCIIMIRSHNPFYCHKFPIEQHPNYKRLSDYDKNNAYDVSKLKVVMLDELEQQRKDIISDLDIKVGDNEKAEEKSDVIYDSKKVDICINSETIEYDSFEEAELYDDGISGDEISEEYMETSKQYGEISELESFDLGDPIRERTEVYEDEIETEEGADLGISIDDIGGIDEFFSASEEQSESIEDIADCEPEAELTAEEFFPEAVDLFDEDDFGFTDDMM